MKYWVYESGGDEAGTVVEADSPSEVLEKALAIWPPESNDGEIWAYELGAIYQLR